MPVIPITLPGFTQNITIPDLEANPTSSMGDAAQSVGAPTAVDAVIDGLAAIGLTKGWVTFSEIILVIAFIFFAIMTFMALVVTFNGGIQVAEEEHLRRHYGKLLQVLMKDMMESQPTNKDVEKGAVENEVNNEAECKQTDTDSVKTLVEE